MDDGRNTKLVMCVLYTPLFATSAENREKNNDSKRLRLHGDGDVVIKNLMLNLM